MTSEAISKSNDRNLDDLLNRHFAGRVVRKDLTKLVKEGANVPVYVLEYLLGSPRTRRPLPRRYGRGFACPRQREFELAADAEPSWL